MVFTTLAGARPRPPLAPLPSPLPVLWHATFDALYVAGMTNTAVVVPNYGTLVQSWSGLALERAGTQVTPLVVPALDATGRTNYSCGAGALMFWITPYWSSTAVEGGTGPGAEARLLELAAVGDKQAEVVWSLQVSPDGDTLILLAPSDAGPLALLKASIAWRANEAHLVVLNYGPQGTALLVDAQLAAQGAGTVSLPEKVGLLALGSTLEGTGTADAAFDEVQALARPVSAAHVAFYYLAAGSQAAMSWITEAEDAARRERAAKRLAEQRSARSLNQMMSLLDSGGCVTGGQVYLTNLVCSFDTNVGWTVTFDITGGTNGVLYDIFFTTNLVGSNVSAGPWGWLGQGTNCGTYTFTNQPGSQAFYVLGDASLDPDGDGLSTAFELLVRKTDPTVGENRVQSENAITGTADWQLSNPVSLSPAFIPGTTNTYLRSWPTNDADTTPEIEGFASATSVNVRDSLTLYVDVRNGDTNFTVEVFRMGWYGGLGGRKMAWYDNGQPISQVTLLSQKQPFPGVNPTNGLIDCLLTNNPNGPWERSYTLTIPPDWVSGVYVAKLTTGTNVTPQTTGRQSYIVFVVREDARPSDLLFQASVTTYQAYNPWGGRSLYLDIPNGAPQGTNVSFNRPYGLYNWNYPFKGDGVGAGEFLAVPYGAPSWEYNLVRWLERQGYDVTYTCNVETHRTCPTNKAIKAFLSVGHDEYWSEPMRTHVEAARDAGVNLAFFAANVCFWRIHFEEGERVFHCDKINASDLWRWTVVSNAEISMIGVEYMYNTVDLNIVMPIPLPTGTGVGGYHWAYDYTGLTNGQTLPGLLGYEVDGCWDSTLPPWAVPVECPRTNTIRLADSVFLAEEFVGHSYMTLYTNFNGAQVFATGTMQWNWGLDAFGSEFTHGGTSRVHSAAQQMTHNVLRMFAGQTNAPVLFANADTGTSGDWTNGYGADGYIIAGTNLIIDLPAYAQVTLSNEQVQVWADPSSDPRALLKPGSSDRIASAWTTTNSQNATFTIDVNLTDTNTHQIALYCADWIGSGTIVQKIEVFAYPDTSHALDTRFFHVPPNGVYLVWNLTGHKTIRISKPDASSGNKAMISALLFGTPSQ